MRKARHGSDLRRAFASGYIPKESTACSCIVNCVIALAYGVIAEALNPGIGITEFAGCEQPCASCSLVFKLRRIADG